MQSGCQHRQGGAYPMFQAQRKVVSLPSPHGNHATPGPVAHPTNGIQNMLATQYPGRLRASNSPLHGQQGNTQPQHIIKGHHQQLESQASKANNGFLHPELYLTCSSRSSCHQTGKEANADFYSSTHFSHRSHFGAYVNENSARQSACTSASFQGHRLGVEAQTLTLNYQCICKPDTSSPLLTALLTTDTTPDIDMFSSTPSSSSGKNIELGTGVNFSDKSQQVKSSSTAQNYRCTRVEDLEHSRGTDSAPYQQQVVSSSSINSQPFKEKVLPGGRKAPFTDDQIRDHIAKRIADFRAEYKEDALKRKAAMDAICESKRNSKGTPACPVRNLEHAPKTKSLQKKASVDSDLPVKKHMNITRPARSNGKLLDDCKDKSATGSNDESLHGKSCDMYLPNVMTTLPPLKKLIASLRNVGTMAELDNLSEAIQIENGKKDNINSLTSTEISQIMAKIAAARTQFEEKIPKVLPAMSEITSVELTERHPSLSIDCNLSKEEYKSHGLNVNRTLDDIDKVPHVSCALQHMSEDFGDKVKEEITVSESNGGDMLSENNLKCPNYEDISEDDVPQLAIELPKTEHEKLSSSGCFEEHIYEDISQDEDVQIENIAMDRASLTQVTEPNNIQSPFDRDMHEHVEGQARIETGIISDEEAIPKKQFSPKTVTFDLARVSVETDECLPKKYLDLQKGQSLSCCPSSVLEYDDESDDQDDCWMVIPLMVSDLKFEPEDEDQVDQEQVVQADGNIGAKERLCEVPLLAPEPVPLLDFPEIEVFDTVQSFIQMKSAQFGTGLELTSGWRTPGHGMDSVGEPHTHQNQKQPHSESEDSCETEDSRDYSSGSERNVMTVPKKFWKRMSALQTVDTPPEKEDADVTNMQKSKTRLDCMQKPRLLFNAEVGSENVQHKTNQAMSSKDEVITIDSDDEDDQKFIRRAKKIKRKSSGSGDSGDASCSRQRRHSPETVDSDDEDDQKFKRRAKKIKRKSSGSGDSGNASCSRQRRHSPETVDSWCGTVTENLQNHKLPFEESPAPHHKFKTCNTLSQDVMQDVYSVASHSMQKAGKMDGQMFSKDNDVITIDSDDDDEREGIKMANGISSGSEDSGDDSPIQQSSHSFETSDSEYETAQERLQETKLTSAVNCVPSHDIKNNGQLIEANGGSEHVEEETDGHIMSEERVTLFPDSNKVVKHYLPPYRKRLLSSDSEDSCDGLFEPKNIPTETIDHRRITAKKKSKRIRLSSEDSAQMEHQSVGKQADSPMRRSPVIPRYVVQSTGSGLTGSNRPGNLKLVKESRAYMEGRKETHALKTPKATSKKTDSVGKGKQLSRDQKGKFAPKPIPANDVHRAKESVVQAKISKPILFSRTLSLPSQLDPSSCISSSSSKGGHVSKARHNSASSSLPKNKPSTSTPKQHFPPATLQRSLSYRNPTTSYNPNTSKTGTSSSSATMPSAREKLRKDWQEDYHGHPISMRRDRRSSMATEEDSRTIKAHASKEARPQSIHFEKAPRQVRNFPDSSTALMKKTKSEAMVWTKHIHRDTPREKRYSGGEGYKWSEKPQVAKPRKGSGRYGE